MITVQSANTLVDFKVSFGVTSLCWNWAKAKFDHNITREKLINRIIFILTV